MNIEPRILEEIDAAWMRDEAENGIDRMTVHVLGGKDPEALQELMALHLLAARRIAEMVGIDADRFGAMARNTPAPGKRDPLR